IVKRGWKLVATARNLAQIEDIAALDRKNVLAVALDVTDQAQIDAAVKAAREKFGRIDVLVNNAGYGYQSSVEEGEEAEIRAQFDTNVFGLFALTRAVLPVMRAQKSGHILNITSVAGLIGFPASGYYAASKHAVEGWSDALRAEVGPLGIHVTCVEPGPFRTDWAGRSLKQTPSRIADYAETVGARLAGTKERSGNQAGDPVRASDVMIELTQKPGAPRHIVLGAWGFEEVVKTLKFRLDEIIGQKELSVSADYPAD
ncbi:MAG: SDR family NAD(P)-dependent oxidoreductase, partial [Rhodospirillales bacterium]|nr:SDR family NAD(P)-dependent oxidoreductase [Rhodospirillales bacterium]